MAESITPMLFKPRNTLTGGRSAASRWSAPRPRKGRDGRSAPCSSSAMSSGRLFLDRVGRHQSPSPLHRRGQNILIVRTERRIYHQAVSSVLTGCLTFRDKRKVWPVTSHKETHRTIEVCVEAGRDVDPR